MNLEKAKIGIISLGWLGTDLAIYLKKKGANVWGTVRQMEMKLHFESAFQIQACMWENEIGFSEEVKGHLSQTDVLILNLPPKVFQNGSYADGLVKFIPYLSSSAKVIFTCSTGVYPSNLTDAREDYSFLESDRNALYEAENRLQSELGSNVTILRLAGLIGSDRHPVHYLVKKEINENPKLPVNLIHKTDVIKIIAQVIETNYWGEILNVCHPDHPTREEYYTNKAKLLDLRFPKFSESTNLELVKIVNCSKLVEKFNYHDFESI